VETTTYRLMADVRGTAGGWDLDFAAGAMYSRMSVHQDGDLEPGLIQPAINNGTYVPETSTNAAALFAPTASYYPSSTLDLLDLHGSRELLDLPGGALALGTGVQYFHKATNATNAKAMRSIRSARRTMPLRLPNSMASCSINWK
jgi:hypothetical protein